MRLGKALATGIAEEEEAQVAKADAADLEVGERAAELAAESAAAHDVAPEPAEVPAAR
ncbi:MULTISPECIES: hypothetical protein [unclassified Streptomyces]|uniref:hypothetical protein n=1 Tax=unclassified Streptomyces TaxID=2593676 RepID=UPI00278C2FE1|nr:MULTISPECIES: hypothetical protein [unclassified Streptomyces]